MRYFFDTSALVKRYLPGGDSELSRLLNKATEVIVSSITLAEFYGVMGANLKMGKLTLNEHSERIADGENDFAEFEIVAYNSGIEVIVKRLSAKYAHRTLDNIQLASALVAKPKYFVTADKKLAKLARAEKLNVKLV